LSKLEKGLPPEGDPEADLRWAVSRDILAEYARLKASRAKNSWRGGVPIEPEDIPGKILGEGYTHGQMMELAVRRVFEREHEIAPDVLDLDTTEMLIERWAASMRQYLTSNGYDWDEVEA
jgi:hypothetical protein